MQRLVATKSTKNTKVDFRSGGGGDSRPDMLNVTRLVKRSFVKADFELGNGRDVRCPSARRFHRNRATAVGLSEIHGHANAAVGDVARAVVHRLYGVAGNFINDAVDANEGEDADMVRYPVVDPGDHVQRLEAVAIA